MVRTPSAGPPELDTLTSASTSPRPAMYANKDTLAPNSTQSARVWSLQLPAIELSGPHRKRMRNPLHWAARNGQLEVVKWLVQDKGVPIDLGTSDGTTPFMYAVWQVTKMHTTRDDRCPTVSVI